MAEEATMGMKRTSTIIGKQPDIHTLLAWVYEAQTAAYEWRAESWKDCEFYDGQQWDDVSKAAAEKAGIDIMTINRVFPTINLLKFLSCLRGSERGDGNHQASYPFLSCLRGSEQYIDEKTGEPHFLSCLRGSEL